MTNKIYVFYGSPPGIIPDNAASAGTVITEEQAGMDICSIANAGDVNSDGIDDLIVGASRYDETLSDRGIALIFHGNSAGITKISTAEADTRLIGVGGNKRLGASVIGMGDRNNDGIDDIAAGAKEVGWPSPQGAVHIWHGQIGGIPSGDSNGADIVVNGWEDKSGGNFYKTFGTTLFSAGDLDGDSYIDIIGGATLGTAGSSAGFMARGASMIALSPSAWFQEPGDGGNAALGSSGGGGDFNGDGFAELVIGDPDNSTANSYSGRSFIRYGRQFGKGIKLEMQSADYIWNHMDSAGDFNGDGYPDLIIGQKGNDDVAMNAGAAYIFYGSATGPKFSGPAADAGADVVLYPFMIGGENLKDEFFGCTVKGIGDFDNDGYDDVAVGAWGAFSQGPASWGTIYVFFGASEGYDAAVKVNSPSELIDVVYLGEYALGSGDVNNDGLPDIAVMSTDAWGFNMYVFFSGNGRDITGGNSAQYYCNDYQYSIAVLPRSTGSDYVILGGKRKSGGAGFAKLLEWDGGNGFIDRGNFDATSGQFAIYPDTIDVVPNLNGDTFPDVIIGDYFDGAGGSVSVFYGASNVAGILSRDLKITKSVTAYFGESLSYAGDINGDSYDDIVVGDCFSNPSTYPNVVYVFTGSSTGITVTDADSAYLIINHDTNFGTSLAGGFDLNRDGTGDLVISEYYDVIYLPGRVGMTPGQND